MKRGEMARSGFKRYDSQKHKKKFPELRINDHFKRLTVIEILPAGKGVSQLTVVCRCECSHLVKTYVQSLRKGFVTACESCMALEKKLAREIEAAKEVERLTSHHVDPEELPKRPKWEFAGAEDELIAIQEKQDAAQ